MRIPDRVRPLLLFVLLAAVLAGAAVGANLWKGGLKVGGVRVEGTRVLAEDEILRLAGVKEGEDLFAVDLFAVRDRVRANTYVREVSVKRDAPDRIVITVTERKPAALLAGEPALYLDREGVVLPAARSRSLFDLPVISGAGTGARLVAGLPAQHPAVGEALEILATAERIGDEAYRRISEIRLDGGRDIILYTAESGVPVVFGRGDVAVKLAKFEAFWREVVRPVGAFALEYVDLRYRDQVVVRWKQAPPAPGDSLAARSV